MHAPFKFFFMSPTFFQDSGTGAIEVSRLDGTNQKVIVSKNLEKPRAIVLYPKKGFDTNISNIISQTGNITAFCLFLGCCFGRTGVLCRGSSVLSWTEAADRRL